MLPHKIDHWCNGIIIISIGSNIIVLIHYTRKTLFVIRIINCCRNNFFTDIIHNNMLCNIKRFLPQHFHYHSLFCQTFYSLSLE